MKLVKKWLFPILTCLIVAGAAVLPPYISQVKDGKQFGQVHSSELNADALPVREAWDLLDRLGLYACWYTNSEIIPSFQTPQADVDLAEQTLERLVLANVIPGHLLWDSVEQVGAERILLWSATNSVGSQTPVEFWRIKAYLGNRSVSMDLDGESSLPLHLNLYDPDIAQWLQYKDPAALLELAQSYFDLLGLEASLAEVNPMPGTAPWERRFAVEGTELCYRVAFNGTTLDIGLDQSGTGSYDASNPHDR